MNQLLNEPMSQPNHPTMNLASQVQSGTRTRRAQRISGLVIALLFFCAVFTFSTAWLPNNTPTCDARNMAACTTQCDTCYRTECVDIPPCWDDHWECDGPMVDGVCYGNWYEVPAGCAQSCTPVSYDCNCTEVCDNWQQCDGTCPLGGDLWCQGSCGASANCECRGSGRAGCQSAADCTGATECPFSQQAGSYWTCQANQCVSVCGSGPQPTDTPMPPTVTPVPPTATPVPPTATRSARATPTPQPSRTPFVTPTPIPQPDCPPNPEDYGGSVTRVIPPAPPSVQFTQLPVNPVVVGQDATKRGVDLTTALSVGACTIDWHYRVLEDYVYCGKATCNCAVDNCELRQRWKEWDETCTENYPIAGVTIDGQLSADSVAYINGPLQEKYPGAQVLQGSYRFFPNALARVTQYLVGNPTRWAMQGLKYPLQDPGNWDVTVNVATQPTAHCGPLAWTLPFPKQIPVYLREQSLVR